MTDKPVMTNREALMAELLIDVDKLLERFEKFDETFTERIEEATKNATIRGFSSATMRLKQVTDELERSLSQATTKAANTLYAETERASQRIALLSKQTKRDKLETLFLVGASGLMGGVISTILSLKLF